MVEVDQKVVDVDQDQTAEQVRLYERFLKLLVYKGEKLHWCCVQVGGEYRRRKCNGVGTQGLGRVDPSTSASTLVPTLLKDGSERGGGGESGRGRLETGEVDRWSSRG